MSKEPFTMYKKDALLGRNPYVHRHIPALKLVEHPIYGGDAPVIAICGDYAWCTGFYDPWWCTSDMEDIRRQYDEIKDFYLEKELSTS